MMPVAETGQEQGEAARGAGEGWSMLTAGSPPVALGGMSRGSGGAFELEYNLGNHEYVAAF